jgi:hypothetical protein
LADAARKADADLIRYLSVRDPAKGCNLAILMCRAFSNPAPIERQTWRIRLGRSGIQALCEYPREAVEFQRDAFANDPRIADLNWER